MVAARHGRVAAMPRPVVIRYAGLIGSLLLTVAAARDGATWPWHPSMTARTILAGDNGVLSPVCWLAGTLLLIGAWVLGRKVVPSARWAYVTAALWAAPLLVTLPLGSYDVYSYACQGWALANGHDAYAAGALELGCPWVDAVSPTWLDAPAPYGPVFLILAALAAKTGSILGALIVLRLIAVLGVVLIAVSLPALARRRDVPLERAAWLALACPLVPIHLISGAHNDAVMVGLLVAGLAARKAWVAGVLLGLAVGVKATAIVVLPFAFLLFPGVAFLGAAVGAVGLASLVGLGWITNLAGSGASVQWTSPSTAVGMTLDLFGLDAVPITRILGIAGLVVVLAVLWWRSRRGDPLLGAGLALAATVALAPVFHPWYLTWPLAVLAATLRRDTLWLVVPCAVASALCLPDGYNLALATKAQGAVAMTVLVAVVVVVLVRKRPRVAA
ncbi:polyprenol phosphomannose-dependent alpha 1,6 mannosyltransferase MptB [Actinoplanes sp. NPDC051633]|uniref:polyprenol phosphomannose-dependent alpha 1,6 mannosyltransferase MptB n=1 Tax=Actinoplanes sp. NPDC051633 TaxID=3155670 RepID=UPI00342D10A0